MSYTSMFKAVFILAAAAAWLYTQDAKAAGLLILSGIFLLYQPSQTRPKKYIEKTRYMERSANTPRDPHE